MFHIMEVMGRYRKSFWLLFICTFLSLGGVNAQNAEHSFEFLNIPATPHTIANGGLSLTYVAGNSGIAFDNPALFGEETSGLLYLSYLNYMAGIHSVNALYGRPITDRGTWAVGMRAMHYGKMQAFDKNNIAMGSFSASDALLQGLFSYDLTSKLRGGIALKLIYGNIETYNAFALAVDAGISYYDGDKGLSIGAALTNAGVTLKGFHDRKTAPAWDLRVGVSQSLSHAPFRFHLTAYGLNPKIFQNTQAEAKPLEQVLRHLTIGAEYFMDDRFWIGAGYNPRLAQDLKRQNGNFFSGLSVGAGFNHDYFRVGIAATRYHPSSLSFMISFATNFGNDEFIF